ncbi:hypothetical protein StoSoilB20_36640 [Arthrobacter sp. StoSoilB20]|nr:hypothetical protein StoSoilB20_36640 [Arthrobacter sp. StoSoilB20]
MDLWLPKLEASGELDSKRLTPPVCVQLMRVSGATINRQSVFQIFDAAREEDAEDSEHLEPPDRGK